MMNNKFYQKYKDLFCEDKRLPNIENNRNLKLQQKYYSPALDKSLKSRPNYDDNYQNQFNMQPFKNKMNISDESLVNIQFQSRILPKLKEYDVQINQKIKGKNQNIFSTVNKKIFGKDQQKQGQFYQNRIYEKSNNPEEDQQHFLRRKKYNEIQSSSKKRVRFTQPQIISQKKQFKQDYSSEYKNSFTPLSLSAVTQVNKNLYSYEFQQRKANRKFGKRVFRFKTQQDQSKNNIKYIPQSKQHVWPKKKLDFQQKIQKKLQTQPNQPSIIKYKKQNNQVKFPEKNKHFSFKTQPTYEQKKINQENKIKQEKKSYLRQKQQKLQEQLIYQLEKLQEKYKQRKKSGKFKSILIPKEEDKKVEQYEKNLSEQNHETEHGLSLLFSQYENQYQFVGKRLQDIKNFQRFVPHLLINSYREALLKRVQSKKRHKQRQKKLKKLFDQQNVEYIRSKSPFEE